MAMERGRHQSRMPRRRKACFFCVEGMNHVDYKNTMVLDRFLGARGKMVPSRASGTCARHQRRLSVAIKRARHVALLPYTTD